MPRSCWRATLVCLTIGLAGCTRKHATPGHDADSTLAVSVRPPVPELSQFDVPLEYDFTDMIAKVERAVPLTFGSLDSVHQIGNDKRKHYAFVATRGPFTAYASGALVYLRATLDYSVRASYNPPIGPKISAGCGSHDIRPQMIVELVAPLTLSPSWHLQSHARVGTLTPASDERRDQCKISFLSYDVTTAIVDAAREALTKQLPDIDKEVAKVSLVNDATGWWRDLNRPIHLKDDMWLVLQPQRFRLKGVTGSRNVFTVQAGLDLYPKITTGLEPQLVALPLPPLGRDTIVNGFRIAIDGNIDFASASRSLTKAMGGKEITAKGRAVTIQTIDASSDGSGRLALDVVFTGDANGTLRVVGVPRHNAAKGLIVMPDLDFDLKTKNEVLKVYTWLHSEALLAMLREKAQFPAAPALEHGKELMLKGLNRTVGRLRLTATVDSLAVLGLYVTPEGLVIHATGWGDARAYLPRKKPIVTVVKASTR